MNCCNEYGQCTRGHGCPARETPYDKAARHFWDASPPGYYELIDAPGNWWDRQSAIGKASAAVGLFSAFVLVGLVVFK